MASTQCNCEEFWLYKPSLLFTNPTFCPRIQCGTEVANVFSRALLLSLIIGGTFAIIYGFSSLVISLILIIAMMTPTLFAYFNPNNIQPQCTTSPVKATVEKKQEPKPFIAPMNIEGMKSAAETKEGFANFMEESYTFPTAANPFMNMMPGDSRSKVTAAPVDDKQFRQELDDFFRVQWFNDPTDVFGKTQGQRQFITMPVTTASSDLDTVKQFLYNLPAKTCKEGNGGQCRADSNGSLVWNSI